MSDTLQPIATRAPQFRLWHVLVVTTLAAIVMAAAAPYLRGMTVLQWQHLGVCIAAFLTGSVGLVLFTYHMSRKAVRKIGFVRHRSIITNWWHRVVGRLIWIVGPILAAATFWLAIGFGRATPDRYVGLDAMWAFNAGMHLVLPFIAHFARIAWIGDEGIAIGTYSIPWRRIHLLDRQKPLELSLSWTRPSWRIRIALDAEDAKAFVIKHCSQKSGGK